MRKIEITLLVACIIGLVGVWLDIKNLYFTFLLVSIILALFYFPFGYWTLKTKDSKSLWLILVGLTSFFSLLSPIYKLLFLPGWFKMVNIGIASSLFGLTIILLIRNSPKVASTITILKIRSVFWVLITLVMYLIPQTNYVTFAFNKYPDLVESFEQYQKNPTDTVKAKRFFIEFSEFHAR